MSPAELARDIDAAEAAVTRCARAGADVESIVAAIHQAAAGLTASSDAWRGAASRAFKEAVDQDCLLLMRLSGALRDAATVMSTLALRLGEAAMTRGQANAVARGAGFELDDLGQAPVPRPDQFPDPAHLLRITTDLAQAEALALRAGQAADRAAAEAAAELAAIRDRLPLAMVPAAPISTPAPSYGSRGLWGALGVDTPWGVGVAPLPFFGVRKKTKAEQQLDEETAAELQNEDLLLAIGLLPIPVVSNIANLLLAANQAARGNDADAAISLAAAAVPGGGAERDDLLLARAGRYNLAVQRGSKLRGFLEYNEGLLEGGHTIDRHVGKDPAWLAQRATTVRTGEASSFYDAPAAEDSVATVLRGNGTDINTWMASVDVGESARFEMTMPQPVGHVVNAAGDVRQSAEVRVVLRKVTDRYYQVVTAYLL